MQLVVKCKANHLKGKKRPQTKGRVLPRVRYIEYESEHRLGGELAIRASEDERNHGLGREHAGTRTRASKGNDETKQGQERV